MDDKRIENLLRSTLRITPPQEMRHRTLRLARLELKKQQAKLQILGMSWWKAALAACGVVIIVLANISDSARQERIDAMVCSPSASVSQMQIARVNSFQEWESWRAEILNRLYEIEGTDAL